MARKKKSKKGGRKARLIPHMGKTLHKGSKHKAMKKMRRKRSR